MKKCFFILLMLPLIYGHAQITGTVTDSKTKKPIAEVEVFIHGQAHYTFTNADGQFVLGAIHPGFADVVLYKKGYQLFKSSIRIQQGKAYALNLTIIPSRKEKGPKIMKADDWSGDLQKFGNLLLGKEYGASCSIMNGDVLSFTKSPEGTRVKSSEPLLINNNSLGYHVLYYLQTGVFNDDKTTLQGYYTFLPMQAQGSDQVLQWASNRLKTYEGSERHVFKSIIEGNTEAAGFLLFDKRGGRLNAASLMTPSISNYHKILLTDTANVQFKTKSGELKTSQLIPKGSLQVNDEGILLIPSNLETKGSMRIGGVINLLPQDYEPSKSGDENFMRYYEKIYVQTDKPYYYPGEPFWFKGYINYRAASMRDSLSGVVYVEIISPKKGITLSKVLKIDSGFFHGDFIFPDTLLPGTYYLRAYTNLNRNFTSENLFLKPIPVLNITDKADPVQGKPTAGQDGQLTIVTDKQKYKTREKISLTVQVKDAGGTPLSSNISISVTDAGQVVPVLDATTINKGFPLDRETNAGNMEFKYPMESGIGFSGRFLNDKGKPEKTSLTVFQLKPRNMMLAEANDQGLFELRGLQFYDTATFSIKSDEATDMPYGKVELLKREIPPVDFKEIDYSISILKTESAQRLISEYEVPKDTRLLEAVEVKGRRIHIDETNDPDYRVKRSYGRPDYVLTKKDLHLEFGYGNLIYHIQGKVPGLKPDMTFARSGMQSINFQGGPLVTLNDVPLQGSTAEILSMIDPNTVESVEFTTRVNVLYGSQGGAGVIAIYTNKGANPANFKIDPNFQQIKIHGYWRPGKFNFPDYNLPGANTTKPDYRATIYWNPEILTDAKTGTATVSFFTADLPGIYRIVGEGVTQNGEPVRRIYFIDVDND